MYGIRIEQEGGTSPLVERSNVGNVYDAYNALREWVRTSGAAWQPEYQWDAEQRRATKFAVEGERRFALHILVPDVEPVVL